MPDERSVKARFEVEATGDQAALDRAADGLDKIAEKAREAEGPLEAAADAAREVGQSSGEAARELEGSYASLGETTDDLLTRGAKLAENIGLAADAFATGYAAGTQLREGLAAIDAELGTNLLPDLDAFVQKWTGFQAIANHLFGPDNSPARQAEELANILHVLEGKGITPVSGRLEDLREQLRQVSEGQGAVARETVELQTKTEAWAKGLGLSRQELDQTAGELAKFIQRFREQNQELDQTAFGEAIRGQVQGLLDSYRILGAEVPTQLQKVAETFGIFDSRTEAVLEKQKGLIQSYADQLGQALGGAGANVRENAAAIQEALKGLSLEQVQLLPPGQREEFKAFFEDLVAQVRAAGGPITQEMVQIGNQVGVLLTEMAPLSPEAQRMAQSFAEAGKSLRETSQGAGELGTALPGEALDQAAENADRLASSAGEGAERIRELGEASTESGKAVREQGQAANEAAQGTGRAAQEADKLAQAQATTAEKSAELSENLDRFGEVATRVESAATKIATALERLGQLDVSGTLAAIDQIDARLDQLDAKAKSVGVSLEAALGVEEAA